MQNQFTTNVSPCLVPMWDNSSRRKNNAFIFTNESPEYYGEWLSLIKSNYPWSESKEKFLFINAWNEWAEGNLLEPDSIYGFTMLKVMKEALRKYD